MGKLKALWAFLSGKGLIYSFAAMGMVAGFVQHFDRAAYYMAAACLFKLMESRT